MQKPIETKKLYNIAAILYAAAILLNCLLFPVSVLLNNGRTGLEITPGEAGLYYLPNILMLVYPLFGFWLFRKNEITPQSTKLTAILLPSFWCGIRLLNYGNVILSNRMLDSSVQGTVSILKATVQIPLKLTGLAETAGFILLCCACAREYVLTHPAPDGTKQLTRFAGICAAAGLFLQITSILFAEQCGRLFSSAGLVLPLKWKCVLLGLLLFQTVPFAAAAIWFWLHPDSTRQTIRLIVSPILYAVPGLLLTCVNPFIFRLAANDGLETISAYSIAGTVSEFFNILHFAALILICCAGTIADSETKQTPSDGESSNI